jgi:hypothetical protein
LLFADKGGWPSRSVASTTFGFVASLVHICFFASASSHFQAIVCLFEERRLEVSGEAHRLRQLLEVQGSGALRRRFWVPLSFLAQKPWTLLTRQSIPACNCQYSSLRHVAIQTTSMCLLLPYMSNG